MLGNLTVLWYIKVSKRKDFQLMPNMEQEYKDHNKELEQQILFLKEQVDFLTRKLYGTKSEKTSTLEIEGQMSLFDEIESCADPDIPEPDLIEVEKHLRKKKVCRPAGGTGRKYSPQQGTPYHG